MEAASSRSSGPLMKSQLHSPVLSALHLLCAWADSPAPSDEAARARSSSSPASSSSSRPGASTTRACRTRCRPAASTRSCANSRRWAWAKACWPPTSGSTTSSRSASPSPSSCRTARSISRPSRSSTGPTPRANRFDVTEELRVLSSQGTHHRAPDIVCYVNGIPLVVIEAKRPGRRQRSRATPWCAKASASTCATSAMTRFRSSSPTRSCCCR